MIRRTVHYSGHVQGVGFRYTTNRIAAKLKVTGFVRNLPDGRVELVTEGDKAEVDRFTAAIAQRLRENIEHADMTDRPAAGGFNSFDIAY
jgi:acylphosphatase